MEYWYNNYVHIKELANDKIQVILYYGSKRQYSICTTAGKTESIEKIIKTLKGERKNVTPIHGVTNIV
nr:hypothetical protein [uncultured Flavobacterium sp.]